MNATDGGGGVQLSSIWAEVGGHTLEEATDVFRQDVDTTVVKLIGQASQRLSSVMVWPAKRTDVAPPGSRVIVAQSRQLPG